MITRVLIVSHEAPGLYMSGPAIRYWHLANVLAQEFRVSLAVPGEPMIASSGLEVYGYRRQDGHPLQSLVAKADVIVVAGFLLHRYRFLKNTGKPLVVDLYDPFIIENLEVHKDKPLKTQEEIHATNLAVLNEQLKLGDFFICAHESQRDFWLGMLAANNRVNPCTLADDPTLRRLIDVVPFGLQDIPPRHRRPVLKGVIPGIGPGDRIIYWGGGLWEWFDPLTAIRAVARVIETHPNVRLFFAGTKHPNPDVPPMRMCEAARKLSDSLGLTNRWVFFNDWIPYEERENYLLEADIGISLHFDHIETRFSFRTRLLDYIWASLPMVVTSGDPLSELVAKHNLGLTVSSGDVRGVQDALLVLLEQPDLRHIAEPRFAAVRKELTWKRVAEPLLNFCREPRFAPDHLALSPGEEKVAIQSPTIVRAWQKWRQAGMRGLAGAIRNYLRWRFTG